MQRHQLIVAVAVATFAIAGCKRGSTPAAEVQSQTAQQSSQPTTISGCLKVGEAADTYVLSAKRTEGSTDTATYQLVGSGGANLREHVGHNVEVTGTIQATEEVASRTGAQPTNRATGTAGTPTVQTRTDVEIKRLQVNSVKPLGNRCD